MRFPTRVSTRTAVFATLFALIVCLLQIIGVYIDAPGLNGGVVAAFGQLSVMLGIAYGIYRGGFGWAGIITLLAILPAIAALGPIILLVNGVIDLARAGIWIAYGVVGIALTPVFARATWQMWKGQQAAGSV